VNSSTAEVERIVGTSPAGSLVPPSIELSMLFQLKCAANIVHFGLSPFYLLLNSRSCATCTVVRAVEGRAMTFVLLGAQYLYQYWDILA